MSERSRWFVSTEWLAGHLDDDEVAIVDGTWHLPTLGRDAEAEYRSGHIPGAVFFDIDRIADTTRALPHMLPSPEVFAAGVGELGIDERQTVVVYDSIGLASAPRLWWTFKVMGARTVVILDGGLPKWRAEGWPIETGAVTRARRRFTALADADPVRDLADIRRNLTEPRFQLVDARPAARFFGEAPEPRSWVKTGRVPGSLNVPSGDLIADGRLKDADALRQAFVDAGVDLGKPIVTSCGSGVNAATLSLALDIVGVNDSALYDGSWTEWGARDDVPIASGRELP
jgi:thiosulfate/3-mercaptopyruvate sulfurtransferase